MGFFIVVREMYGGTSPYLFMAFPREIEYIITSREMKGVMPMDDKEFLDLMSDLKEYLDTNKVFVQNPARLAEFNRAREIAAELFADMEVAVEDDPLQMGALILCIKGYDIIVRGSREIALFQELIDKASNFEIYPADQDKIKFAIVFADVLVLTSHGTKPQ